MRVMMTSVPSIGHVVPMLSLGQALCRAGHDVRVATHPDLHRLIEQAGLRPLAAGITAAEMSAERRRRWPDTEGRPNTEWAFRMFAQVMAPPMRADVVAAIAEWPSHLLIHEEGEYAGPVVATEFGIPWVTHAWGCPLRPHDDLTRLESDAAPLWQEAGLGVPPAAGLYVHGVVDPCPAFLQPTRPGVTRVWPLRPEPLHTDSGPHGQAPPQGPLAYVGFGTVPQFADAPTDLIAAVDGCVANRLAVVVTTSNDAVRQQLMASHGDRVAVRSFVSLPDLLPRCRVAVCHGGAGTVLASLTAGIPLVLLPRGAPSQLRMADACEAAGVATIVPPGDLAPITTAIATATDDAHLERAADAAKQIGAMPSADAIVPALEALASS